MSPQLLVAIAVAAVLLILLFVITNLGKKSRFHTMGRKSYLKKVMEEMAKAEKGMKK